MEYNEGQKWLLGQFYLINKTAKMVYEVIQGGMDQNFYSLFVEYENGTYGWVKEAASFQQAVNIFDELLGNDAFDIINQMEEFVVPQKLTVEEIESFKNFLNR